MAGEQFPNGTSTRSTDAIQCVGADLTKVDGRQFPAIITTSLDGKNRIVECICAERIEGSLKCIKDGRTQAPDCRFGTPPVADTPPLPPPVPLWRHRSEEAED